MSPQPLRQVIQCAQGEGRVDLTDAQRTVIQHRRGIVQAWKTMCGAFAAAGRSKGEATDTFLQGHPGLSKSTLYDWAKRAQSDDPTDLLDRRSTALRCQPGEVSEAAWERFKELWLTTQQRTVKLCWDIVRSEARKAGWTWPALRTIQRKVTQELPPVKADYFRLGEREWHRLWGPKMRRDYDMYRSNQLWVGDFHECDVFCRVSQTDPRITRPLMVAWLDLRSRIIPAFRIVPRENQDAVLLSFRDGVKQWGPPAEVCIDNGKPYRARGFSGGRPGRLIEDEDYVRSVLGHLEVGVHFSLPYNPDSKPIERWFRTFEEQFGATFGSYCGGDNKSPCFKEAHKFAKQHPEKCPTLAEFAEAVAHWLETYHKTPHTGEGMKGITPLQAFYRFDPIPRLEMPEGVIDLALMRTTRPVKVTSYGVRHNGIEYGQSDGRLFALQGQQVILRVDSHEAGYVIVCDLQGKPICKAINNALMCTGTTQENVADGMRRRNQTRKLVRQIHEVDPMSARESVTDAAIRARLDNAKREEAARMKATGTDDVAPRNVKILKSDWAESAKRFLGQGEPRPQRGPGIDLAELMDRSPQLPSMFDDDDGLPPIAPLLSDLPEFFDDDNLPPFPDDDFPRRKGEDNDYELLDMLDDDDRPGADGDSQESPNTDQSDSAPALSPDCTAAEPVSEAPPSKTPGRRSRADEFFSREGKIAD